MTLTYHHLIHKDQITKISTFTLSGVIKGYDSIAQWSYIYICTYVLSSLDDPATSSSDKTIYLEPWLVPNWNHLPSYGILGGGEIWVTILVSRRTSQGGFPGNDPRKLIDITWPTGKYFHLFHKITWLFKCLSQILVPQILFYWLGPLKHGRYHNNNWGVLMRYQTVQQYQVLVTNHPALLQGSLRLVQSYLFHIRCGFPDGV